MLCTVLTKFVFETETVRLLMSMQVDRVDGQRIFWSGNYLNPNSVEYQTLESEANYAVSTVESNYLIFILNTVNLRYE